MALILGCAQSLGRNFPGHVEYDGDIGSVGPVELSFVHITAPFSFLRKYPVLFLN
jgi:hypothetical protein